LGIAQKNYEKSLGATAGLGR